MISKDNIIEVVIKKLKKMKLNQFIDLRTYKRNRSVVIVKIADGEYLIIEDGYEKDQFPDLTIQQVKKTLKTLLKREFPRSNKVRLYTHDSFEFENYSRVERKKI